MFRRRKIPDWVKDLPEDDSNRELLVRISEASPSPLETPREMNFTIKNFASKSVVEAAADRAKQEGWECTISQDVQNKALYWLEARQNGYVLGHAQLERDENFFIRLANLYKATYDGWFASIV